MSVLVAGSAPVVFVRVLALVGGPVAAQGCAGVEGTPTDVAVEAVPIVVESTVGDHFVLYASYDVDGETVEYPVRVVLGQDGTTALSENVAALPAERYRVEKYSIDYPGISATEPGSTSPNEYREPV